MPLGNNGVTSPTGRGFAASKVNTFPVLDPMPPQVSKEMLRALAVAEKPKTTAPMAAAASVLIRLPFISAGPETQQKLPGYTPSKQNCMSLAITRDSESARVFQATDIC